MKCALFLSGCGQLDGSETHEVILTLLSLAQENIEWMAFAPNIDQSKVVDHVKAAPDEDAPPRNVLKESARLVRGNIKPITEFNANDYDTVILPGGTGAVCNLCNWSEAQGGEFTLQKDVQRAIDDMINAKKPMGFICIAPVMIPKLFPGAKLTIGNDKTIAEQIKQQGSTHIECAATDVVVDTEHNIVSTPANMVAKSIDEVYTGIHKLVKALVEMV